MIVMTSKRRDWLRNFLSSLLGSLIANAVSPYLKPLALAVLSSFPLFLIAIRRMMPHLSWPNVTLAALSLTLAFILPSVIMIVAAKSQPDEAWKLAAERISEFILAGRRLQSSASDNQTLQNPENWLKNCDKWLSETHGFISNDCPVRALAKFLDDTSAPAVLHMGIPQGIRVYYRTLEGRLANLHKIVENADTYL